ncbi:MAG: hypothetical protein HYX76_16590 [Acidobacteria bacterium]|nr:hypothetical protein [Acidobacteriota bacterium]
MNRRDFVLTGAAAGLAGAACRRSSSGAGSHVASMIECLADAEPGLDVEARQRLQRNMAALQAAVQQVRAVAVPPDVEPAFRFSPIRSRRR